MKRKLFTLFVLVLFMIIITSDSTPISETLSGKGHEGFIKTSVNNLSLSDKSDLVFHDYGSGIKLSSGSSCTISRLDLELRANENAIIYVLNLNSNIMEKLCDYTLSEDINYVANSDGVYKIIAIKNNGDIIDLTPKASIAVKYDKTETNGLILLK